MEFVKKNTKLIIGLIIGILLVSGMSVYATYKYFANEIKYTDDKTVTDALNDLYSIKEENSSLKLQITDLQKKETELNNLKTILGQTDATASDILSGKKAYTQNSLITGTLKKEAEIITYKDNVSNGSTINVSVGNYVIVSSPASASATNSQRLRVLYGGSFNNIGTYTSVFKATASTMKITPDNNCNFSYIIIK